nr:MAG TPA: hypothetical protein [Caudoviricetes sp.]
MPLTYTVFLFTLSPLIFWSSDKLLFLQVTQYLEQGQTNEFLWRNKHAKDNPRKYVC